MKPCKWSLVVSLAVVLSFVTSNGAENLNYISTWEINHPGDEANHAVLSNDVTSLELPHRQKRFIGAIVGGVLAIGSIFMGRKQAEAAARQHEASMKIQLEKLCMAVCVSEWAMWEECSRPCGKGIRSRTRKDQSSIGKCGTLGKSFKCPHALMQQEHCNEVCPHGGTPVPGEENNDKPCECKKGWLGKCCNDEAICRYPGKPTNGRIHGTWPAKFRAIATYTCNEGFTIVGGTDESRCLANETWTGRKPSCERIYCKEPRKLDHVQILNPPQDSRGYRFGEEVVYMCDNGYVLRGPEKRRCNDDAGATTGRWSGFDPRCFAVKCDDPGVPLFGDRIGTSFTFMSSVNFTCDRGYKLLGSKSMTCMASGNWLGRFPECSQIKCDPPLVPKNGDVILRRATFGALVSFTCDDGYRLEGSRVLKCGEDGNWNGTEPRCKAAKCKTPGTPKNGAKSGSLYYYPHNVTYHCYNGYMLKGSKTLSCQQNAEWTAPIPKCEACPMNSYMDDIKAPGRCTPCPSNTHTLTNASTSKLHCICNEGFTGPSGGPCREIRCIDLSAPEHGSIVGTCDNKLNESCYFECNDGYTIDKGSSMRTCQENADWDGEQPSCAACPVNTFKADERSCQPCPRHSHTVGEGNMKKGCVCDAGYEGPKGGPCTDVNECLANNGKGKCSDECENNDGGYKCRCPIVGHTIDPTNGHKCIVEDTCRNLTETDAPINGGLVCHRYYKQNSQQCSARCNHGYEFPSRTNNYETCGPNTGFTWSHQQMDLEATFPACIEQFFPDLWLETKSNYFVSACKDLTEEEKIEVKETFAKVLNDDKVCKAKDTELCSIEDMVIICGLEQRRRRRRGVEVVEHSLDIKFNVTAVKLALDNNFKGGCPVFCARFGVPANQCDNLCQPLYNRFIKGGIMRAQKILERLGKDANAKKQLRLRIEGEELEPETFTTSPLNTECPEPGMVYQDEKCIPCAPGQFFYKRYSRCIDCPPTEYQILPKQLECVKCPPGSTTYRRGSRSCEACKDGKFGKDCRQKCPKCLHGSCHSVTGKCICNSGWEGDLCNQDIDGCKNANCFKGVKCSDEAAPASGFKCGSCPPGFHGDGAECVPEGKPLPSRGSL